MLAGLALAISAADSSASAAFNTKSIAKLFVAACLDGSAKRPKGAMLADRQGVQMPKTERLANEHYYRLVPGWPVFLRVADPLDKGEVVHLCEVRAPQLVMRDAWPIIAGAVDRRIDARPTPDVNFYSIDYPGMEFRVLLGEWGILLEQYRDDVAS